MVKNGVGGRAGSDLLLAGPGARCRKYQEDLLNAIKYNQPFNKERLQYFLMDLEALVSDSIDYTREALAGQWVTWLVFIICALPMALLQFVFDPTKFFDKTTAAIHWELIPWPEFIGLCIAGFFLSFITAGYMVRVYRGITPPPVFDQWGSLYLDGIKVFIVGLLWFVPAFVVMAVAVACLIIGIVSNSPSIALVLAALLLLLAAFVIVIIACLYSALGCIRFARTGSIREGIRFSAISETIRTMGWGTYIIALLVLLAVGIIFSIIAGVLSIIPYLGWVIDLVINPLLVIFTARFMSRVYDHGVQQAPVAVVEPAP
jgi:hypothetical protein